MGLPVGSALDLAQVTSAPAAPSADTLRTFARNGQLYTEDSNGVVLLAGTVRELEPVRVATSLSITLSGTQTIDGVAVAVGDRVLVRYQSTVTANGVYVVAAGAWSRAPDADTVTKIQRGTRVKVLEGTLFALQTWTQIRTLVTLGTTTVEWRQLDYTELVNPVTYPPTPSAGQTIFDTTRGQQVVWDGGAWRATSGIISGLSTAYPSTPGTGSIYYETDTGITKIYDGTAWRTIGSSGSSDAGPYKQQRARVAALANVNTVAPGAVIDGITLAAGDRVLLTAQTAPAQNGVWAWNGAAAAMTRTTDADSVADIIGAFVVINEGTAAAGREYKLFMPANGTLGTTAIVVTFERDGGWYGNPFGIAPLDGDGKVPLANLPTGGVGAGEIESWGAVATASLSATTNVWTDVPGCAVTVPVTSSNDKFLVVANADTEIVSTGAIGFMDLVAGSTVGFGELAHQGPAGARTMVGQNWIITGLAPGNNVFKLRAMNYTNTGTAAFYVNSTKFSVVKLQSNGGGSVSAATQAGAISMWSKATPPAGWMLCNGGTFSSTTYPELAATLGDTYGTHAGTTYYLPDMDVPGAVGTTIARNVGEVFLTGNGPYSAAAPGATSGASFTAPVAGTLVGTVNATSYTTTTTALQVDAYVNGASLASLRQNYAHSGVNAHVSLSEANIAVTVNAGTNYLYLRNMAGTSDAGDVWTMNARLYVYEKTVSYIVKVASDPASSDSGWIAPTLQNSWVNYGAPYAPAGYRKIGNRVTLRGLVKSGTIPNAIFTLPAGFTPPYNLVKSGSNASLTSGAASTGTAHTHPILELPVRVDITSAGAVVPANTGSSNSYISLDEIEFYVD